MGTGFTGSGLLGRLYRGETKFDFIGVRKRWYLASAIILLICVLSIIFRGFNFGIDFAGGDSYQLPVRPGVTLQEVRSAVGAAGVEVSSAQTAGAKGATTNFVIDTETQSATVVSQIKANLVKAAHVKESDITTQQVSKSWGGEVTRQAIIALIVFLVAVGVFIAVRFAEWRMALAALLALLHDLLLTAGVYSLVGFEVSPSTIVGLLTILGFSLYDTVVVFDKVSENSKGILSSTRMTYPEAANLAVNQTLMRSINTSIIGLLPVAGLLFVGAGLLGVGTLEDLALVLFVGMLTGAYSSLFLATPWLVDFKLFDPRYRNHVERVMSRRAAIARGEDDTTPSARRKAKAAARAAEQKSAKPAAGQKTAKPPADDETEQPAEKTPTSRSGSREDALASTSGSTPRVGAKPANKRNPGSRPSGNRPGGSRRR
ncbi:MAG TPA: protein translocase subunit SecF [Micromonosporaceae bacterium]|nr:protein translocase subunit SecF [Micromonosporaceae bacterium]